MNTSRWSLFLAIVSLAMACAPSQTNRQRPSQRVAAVWVFSCEPRDARLVVDEVDQGACLLWQDRAMALGPGTHRLRIEKMGFLPDERDLPETGRRTQVSITLRERPE